MSPVHTGFADLTWDDLTAWAGSKIVSRGRSYKSHVREMNATLEGGIVAWVHGTEVYATRVWLNQSGELCSACSCPYDFGPCKHSVALILVYLDALKKNQTIPDASPDDRRLRLLAGSDPEDDSDELETWDEDESSEDLNNEDEAEDEGDPARKRRSSSTRKTNPRAAGLRRALEAMSQKALVDFIMDLTEQYPDVGQHILEKEQIKSGKVGKIVLSIRSEIEELSKEPGWCNSWSDEGHIPDYSRVRERLKSLLDAGHADEVVELGEELWRLGNKQIEMSHDEGETGEEIAICMEIVFRAIPKSSLSPSAQMVWMINTFIQDNYSMLDSHGDVFSDPRYQKAEWSLVADSLLAQLNKLPKTPKQDDYSTTYKREQIMHWAIEALETSGRKAEVIPLLEREAPITQCYSTLIEHLLSAHRKDDARKAAIEGFGKTINQLRGIAWKLEGKLREMAQDDKNLPLVAGYRALEFFDKPSLQTYESTKKAAQAIGEWPGVREAILHYLETGVRPDMPVPMDKKKNLSGPPKAWDLPPTEISLPYEKPPRNQFPDIDTLITIAIHEKRNDDVIRWHEVFKKGKFWGYETDESVAEAVQTSHPDVSLEIWRQLAEGHIKQVKPAAYRAAATYLRKMQKVYQRTGRVDEWLSYFKAIRTQHKAKRTLMEILDSFEGKRIVES